MNLATPIINGNLKRWTIGAKECYQRGCNCKGCYYSFLDCCRMKYTVLGLVRVLGIPKELEKKKEEIIKD